MKRLLYPILLLLFAIATQAQNIPSYVPTNGLVGWWPFNGNANDESGNGNHGTVNGATLTSDRNGVVGKAYSFDPSQNSHILVPFSNSLNSIQSGITLSAWIFMDGGTGAGTPPRILELRGAYGGGGDAGFVMLSQSNSNQSRTFELRWHNNFGNSNVSIPSTSQTLSALNWHNIIFTGDGTTGIAKCYFDGVLIQTITQNIVSTCNYNNNPLVIGAEPNLLGKWGGKLDDIAIYNRALSQQEITALYTGNPPCTSTSSNFNLTIPSTSLPYTWNGLTFTNSGSQTAHLTNASGCDSAASLNLTVTNTIPSYLPTNGLVGWWPFNGNANDESGNGNHGTVNGATLTSDRNGVAGKAFSFNGNGNYIGCSSNNLPQSSRTISVWFNANNLNGGPAILGYGGNTCGRSFFIAINQPPIPNNIINQGHCLADALTTSFMSNSLNQWYNLVITSDNNGTKHYLNGTLLSSNSISITNTYTFNKDFAIGTNVSPNGIMPYVDGNQTWWDGSLDDIAIYNRALTQQEITALYTGVPLYHFTASSGPNGSITPIGTTTLNQGSTQGYSFNPNTGYLVDSVIVDGNKVDSIQGYTFSNISANHSIRVIFKIDSNNVSMNFPTGISYQAVARDSAGKVLANSPVKLRFSIKENSMNGNTVYSETANLTTNKLGLFNCIIGNNNATYGNYKNIDWMGATKYLQLELEQGNAFVLLGTQQLLSVPYANAANESNQSKKIKNSNLPIYPDNNAALQGGLQAGEMYRTAAGILMIVY